MQNYDLSIVLPVYKPEPGWIEKFIGNIHKVKECLSSYAKVEFIVINDGEPSDEMTHEFEYLTTYRNDMSFLSYEKNRGKGYALRKGIAIAKGPMIIFTDFDFPYAYENIVSVYKRLLEGYDVVIGNREKGYYGKLPLKRKLLSKAANILSKYLLGLPFRDLQSGLKGFNHRGKEIILRTNIDGYLMDTEFVNYAYRSSCNINAVDVSLRDGISFSELRGSVIGKELNNFLFIWKSNGNPTKVGKRSSTATISCPLESSNHG